MGKANFTLLRNLVMIYPIVAKQQSSTGIIVMGVDKNAPQEGMVVAVGPGEVDKKGVLIPPPVKQGDRVVFTRGDAREIKYEKDTFIVVPDTEILCKLEAQE